MQTLYPITGFFINVSKALYRNIKVNISNNHALLCPAHIEEK
jgi:hypothetical protein